MALRRPQPRMLNDVMDAIANLKEPKGSTMRRILNQLETNYTFHRKSSKLTPQPIMKALRHGVEMGLIRKQKGKFKLGLDPKDYAVYKTFQRKLNAREVCGPGSRRRRRQRRRRSKSTRRRHADIFGREPKDEEKIQSSLDSDSTNPEDKARRKRKKGKRKPRRKSKRRGGRRGKRRGRSFTSDTSDDSTRDQSPKSSRHSSRSESDHNGKDNQRKDNDIQEQERQYHPNCGNPECLCNVNQVDHVEEDN